MKSKILRVPGYALFAMLAASPTWAQPAQPAPAQPSSMRNPDSKPAPLPPALQGVTIEQNLNHQIPLELVFRDEFGRSLPLSTYFSGHKPVILALVYYTCPMLCNLVLTGVESSLRAISLDPGRDFEVVAVSFDPHDTPEIAAAKRANYLQRYRRPNTANGWHFLTGDERSIAALTSAVGFRYKLDPATGQYAHASAIMILTPEGKLSRYYYGVEYAPRDVRLGLVEQNRLTGGSDPAVLLPLRSGHRQIRRDRHEHGAFCRRHFRFDLRHIPVLRVAPRLA
jgi:protein SCO1